MSLLSYSLGLSQEVTVADSIDVLIQNAYELKNQSYDSKAFRAIDQAKEQAERANDELRLAICYNLYASLYLTYDENLNKVPDLLQVASDLLFKVKDKGNLIINDRLWAEYYLKLGKYEQADTYIEDAATHIANDSLTDFLGGVKLARGQYYLEKQEYDETIETLKNALPIIDPYEGGFLNALAHVSMASAYNALKKTGEAEQHAKKALQMASRDADYPLIKIEANKLLGDIAKTQNNLVDAVFFLEKHYSLKDSILTIEKAQAVNRAANRSALDLADTQLKQKDEELEKSKETTDRQNMTIILSSALLIIISLLTISLYRNNVIKIKTNKLLLKKNSELVLAKDEAEAALKAKANFLSTVSHELRTPLYAVTGLTRLLMEEDPKEHQKEYLKSLKFSGDYLLALINDILQLNKMEAQKLTVYQEDISLREVVKEVSDSMAQTSTQNRNKITINIDDAVPEFVVGDKIKLSQVLINLVGNALKFTKDGEVQVNLKYLEEGKRSHTIYFEVRDDGIGISEEKQKTIFESFSQGSKQINRKYGGTGLGLSIVKSLLELVNSNINLESELGKGSAFSFSIKFKKSKKQTVTATPKIEFKPSINPASIDNESYQGMHILLVEDNKINQVITKKMITKKGMTCDIANNGFEAIDLIKANHYELVLMDIHMPGMGGVEATTKVREFNKELPIIALTAVAIDENMEEFMDVGFSDVISKPFKPEDFYRSVNTFLIKDVS
ncbi:ATP-binding protein [Spongiivirga citrea]|uniref:histidine kinase n=1 Tax=Spongiivirga citrea TaxID=1481457 RepID=A0A6M0CR89_9FLAO|nr:ATP-binding protein [Spongiivirga citrea]NER18379.1 response regulator [Spongiivirga citrea]